MTSEKLKEIIETKNGDLERIAISKARQLIDGIANEQRAIEDSHMKIAQLRSELQTLQISQIDAASILGD